MLALPWRKLPVLGGLLAAVTLGFGCSGAPPPYLIQLDQSRSLATDLRIQFTKASDASDRAVMADTDEASAAFAHEAEQALQVVEHDQAALAPLLRVAGRRPEIQLLEGFQKHFAEYRTLDRRILALAVENTNLKAQRLSFGPVKQVADSFRDSLAAVPAAVPLKDRCRAQALAAKATVAVREIQVLQAPHIAEADDAAMTHMEKEMADLYTQAGDAVKDLTALAPPKSPGLTVAASALDQFKVLSDQLVALSRRNTNVLSLELSLREKPPLTSACDGNLRALQEALEAEGSKATR